MDHFWHFRPRFTAFIIGWFIENYVVDCPYNSCWVPHNSKNKRFCAVVDFFVKIGPLLCPVRHFVILSFLGHVDMFLAKLDWFYSHGANICDQRTSSRALKTKPCIEWFNESKRVDGSCNSCWVSRKSKKWWFFGLFSCFIPRPSWAILCPM